MRNYKQEYENYHSKPSQKKKRASRNQARRTMERTRRITSGQDVDHKDGNANNNSPSNLRIISKSDNRSYPRTKSARKK